MPNVTHASLTGSDLHEPKGASSASANTVHIANGSGSTSWAKIGSSNIDTASIFNSNKFKMTVVLADISTASSIKIVIPVACTLDKAWGCLQGTIATADSVVTLTNHAGASMGTMTVAFSGSAAGDVDSLTPASNNSFTAGQVLTITTDGASSNAIAEVFTLELTQTA